MFRPSRTVIQTLIRCGRRTGSRSIVTAGRRGRVASGKFTSKCTSFNGNVHVRTTMVASAQVYVPRTSVAQFHTSHIPQKELNFLLADIGEGIHECEIMQWFVSEGATIKQFDKVCEVQSDKATVEITSRYDGVVKSLCYKKGDMAIVGKPLIKMEVPDGEALPTNAKAIPQPRSAAAAEVNAEAHLQEAQAEADENSSEETFDDDGKGGKVLTTPAVRRIARQEGVALANVRGTGPKGRIMKEDVMNYVSKRDRIGAKPAAHTPTPAQTPTATPASAAPTAPKPASTTKPFVPPPMASTNRQDRVEKISGIQRVMVQTMTKAHTVPTLLFCDEIVVDELVNVRKQLKPLADERGINLSYFPFIMKAASLALLKYPRLNSYVNEDCTEVTLKGVHNISLAMDTPRGLLVPSIKNVQDKSVFEIAADLGRLQKSGADGKLGPEDLKGGTITLSNVGSIGGTYAYPIIVQPQVAIAALGKFQVLPRYDANMNLKPTRIMQISWAADHRVLEGGTVAHFSNEMKKYIENPSAMLLDLR